MSCLPPPLFATIRCSSREKDASVTRKHGHSCCVGNFRKLRAWQEAKRFALLSRKAIRALPTEERFTLGAQWRRAAYSVPLNLAEGASRVGDGNFRRHVDIARGSLDELEAILDLVETLDCIPAADLQDLLVARANCARLVAGLLRKLR